MVSRSCRKFRNASRGYVNDPKVYAAAKCQDLQDVGADSWMRCRVGGGEMQFLGRPM